MRSASSLARLLCHSIAQWPKLSLTSLIAEPHTAPPENSQFRPDELQSVMSSQAFLQPRLSDDANARCHAVSAWHGSAHRPRGSPAFAATRRSALGPSRDRQRRIDGQSQPSLWPARSTRKRTGPLGCMIPPFEARRIASIGFAIGLVAKEVTDSHGRASYPSASCPAAIYRAASQAFVVPKSENR